MGQISRGAVSLAISLGILLTWYSADAMCPVATINETEICQNVNSTGVVAQLPTIVLGNITKYACAMQQDLSTLTDADIFHLLANMVNGTINFTTPQLTLLFTKLNATQLGLGLEDFNNVTRNTTAILWKDIFLTALWNAQLSNLTNLDSPGLAEAWFQKRLRPFLSAVTQDILQCLRNVTMACPAYQAIVKGLASQFQDMSATTQANVYSFLWFYMQNLNSTTSPGAVCTIGLANSSLWLNTNLRSFSMFAAYKGLVSLNTNFNGLDALDLLTPTQLADVTVDSGALTSEANITAIFNTLQNRSFADFSDYYAHFYQRNISSVNITVGSTMLNLTLGRLIPQRNQFNSTDYAIWFQQYLLFLLPGISASQLTAIFNNASCASYQAVVTGLDTAYPNMNDSKRMEVYGPLRNFLNQTTTGPCLPLNPTNENRQWLLNNFASFRSSAQYKDFKLLKTNFSGFDVLDLLTSTQIADLTVLSNGIQSDSNITAIFNSLDSRPLADLATYYTQFNTWNLTQGNITVAGTMLNRTLMRLVREKSQLNFTDYADWFQHKLTILLPNITGAQLTQILSNVSCGSFQATVAGVDSTYSSMATGSRQEVYGALLNYLNQTKNASPTGSACLPVNMTNENRQWLLANFQSFRTNAQYSELQNLKPTFSGLDVLDLLTPTQLADVTVDSGALTSGANITAIFNTLQNRSFADFSNYYARFHQRNVSAANITVGETMLNLTLGKLYPQLDHFNSTDYALWFQQYLQFLLPIITSPQLAVIFMNETCASYQAVVAGLDAAYPNMNDSKKMEVYGALKKFLNQNSTGPCLPLNATDENKQWLITNFASFRANAKYADFKLLKANFSGFDVLNLLTPVQLADLTVLSGSINSDSNITAIFTSLDSRPLMDLSSYYTQFNTWNISTVNITVGQTMLNLTLERLYPQLYHFNSTDNAVWFQQNLLFLLPSITSTQLAMVFKNESCASYQAVVSGLSAAYPKMNGSKRLEVYGSLKAFLITKNQNGSACVNGSSNVSDWMAINLGKFQSNAQYQDLINLYKNITGLDVLNLLTPKELAQLSASDLMKSPSDVQHVMSFVPNSAAAEYIDEFNRQANISSLPVAIRYELLNQVILKANLSAASDADFSTWIGTRLSNLLPALNSTLVPSLFLSVNSKNCSTFQTMILALNNSIGTYDNITDAAIFRGMLNYTKGLTCYTTGESFAVYLNRTFQGYGKYLNLDSAFSIVPPARLSEVTNSMSSAEFAGLLALTNFISNDTLLTSLLLSYNKKGEFMDVFNTGPVLNTLPNGTIVAILVGVWPAVMSNNDASDIDTWFVSRLPKYFPFVTKDLLISNVTINATCLSFSKTVNNLAANITLFPGKETDFYSSIKTYLSAAPVKPRCYNSSDTSWFATYLGTFIQYCSESDILELTGNSSVLNAMSVNQQNLNLINSTTLLDGVGELYASALFNQNPNISISMLPDKLLCFAGSSAAVQNLHADQIMGFVKKINGLCSISSTSNGTIVAPSPYNLQLAATLVEKITVVDSSTVTNLGQQAVGLNKAQIDNMLPDVVVTSLESLSKVQGWDAGQGQGLVKKLKNGNFKFDSADRFKQLGTLVVALPSSDIANMPSDEAVKLCSDQGFVTTMQSSEVYLQQAFVKKIVRNNPSTDTLLNTVPDSLADSIPNSMVTFGSSSNLNITAICKKSWSKDQASGFFDKVLTSSTNYNNLSVSVLQGFQCSSGASLTRDQFNELIRVMKEKNVPLDGVQSSCLVKLGEKFSASSTDYPPNVLLFVNDITVTCDDYFKMASVGDISTLASDPVQKSNLLALINTCYLSKNNGKLDKTQLANLGGLVCLLNATVIANADPQIVENLKLCPDLTNVQQSTVLTLLNSGTTSYGAPSSWKLNTFQKLGQLSYCMDSTTLSSVNDAVKKETFKNALVEFRGKRSHRTKVKTFVSAILSSSLPKRRGRGAGCTVGNIIASTIQDPTFILTYKDVTQFDACLDNDVLKANLAALAAQPLPNDYLQVMKTKLNVIYPNGIPEDSVTIMGAALQRLFTDVEISKWKITSEDTLTILMKSSDPAWNDSQAKQILTNYLSGNTFTATALKNVGGPYLCTLDASQISTITAAALKDAGSLDISTCSQDKKDILFLAAKTAFASQLGTPTYYSSIKPYLSGANGNDLRSLGNVSMDIQTFIGLNPNSVKQLTISDVKTLLGTNLADLKAYQANPVVMNWLKNQKQSDLDTLQLGLTGGSTDSLPSGGILDIPMAPGSAVVLSVSFLQVWICTVSIFVARWIL